jgi:hypothetical protein
MGTWGFYLFIYNLINLISGGLGGDLIFSQ